VLLTRGRLAFSRKKYRPDMQRIKLITPLFLLFPHFFRLAVARPVVYARFRLRLGGFKGLPYTHFVRFAGCLNVGGPWASPVDALEVEAHRRGVALGPARDLTRVRRFTGFGGCAA
jgi:hypothetical protein